MTPTPAQVGQAVRQAVEDGGLHAFVRLFWGAVEPGQPFSDNWHIGAVCEFLEAWYRREFANGVIGQPPSTGKSMLVDVMFPAWVWAQEPGHKFINCSFDDSNCLRDADKVKTLVNSTPYAHAWPRTAVRRDMTALGNINTTLGGYRFSTTPRGKATGKHFHSASINDPVKPQDVIDGKDVEVGLADANRFIDHVLPSRRVDPARFGVMITMQRLHEQDPAGIALEQKGYEHLCLPMRYEPQATWIFGDWSQRLDPRTEPGELLHPERYPAETVDELERDMGSHWSAQYQQNPIPSAGGLVSEEHLRFEWIEVPQRGAYWLQLWDFAAKGSSATHSAVHGALWCSAEVNRVGELTNTVADRDRGAPPERVYKDVNSELRFLLIDEVWGIWDVPTSEARFVAAQNRQHWDRAHYRVIEAKAAGIGIIQRFADKYSGVIAFHELDDECKAMAVLPKLDRHRANLGEYHAGRVLLPPWSATQSDPIAGARGAGPDEIRREIVGFPNAARDDRVDTSSMALAKLTQNRQQYWNAVETLAKQRRRRYV